MKPERIAFLQLGIGTGKRAGDEVARYLVDELKIADDCDVETLLYAKENPEEVDIRISRASIVITHSLGAKVVHAGQNNESILYINGPEVEHLHFIRTIGAFARMGAGHLVDSVVPWSKKKEASRGLVGDNIKEIRKDLSAQRDFVKEALEFTTLGHAVAVSSLDHAAASIFVACDDKVAKHSSHYEEKVRASGLHYFETPEARHDTVLVEPAKVLTRAIMNELFPEITQDIANSS